MEAMKIMEAGADGRLPKESGAQGSLALKVLLRTARSLTLEILDEGADYHTKEYDIYINGEKYLTTDKTVETVYGLRPAEDLTVSVGRGGERSEELSVRTEEEFVTLNVRDFGARGDGETDDTLSIQAAIMTCPKSSRVLIPEGTFRFTNLFLKSDLTLELAKGAALLAIPDREKVPILPGRIESYDEKSEFLPGTWEGGPMSSYASILTGIGVENVVICGLGTLDGNAGFDNWWDLPNHKNDPNRPRMIFLNHCRNVTVQGITVKNSPAWNLHPYFSQHLKFYDLHIESPSNSPNTDGLNPESCTDVEIAGVHFSVGDDCIAVKSGTLYMGRTYKTPSRDILIHHCLMEKGHGAVTIGSEIAAGVDNIRIRDCRFLNTDRGLRVKTRRGRGKDSYLQGITFEGIHMEGVLSAFVINSFYFCGPDGRSEYVATKEKLPVDERTPRIGKIVIRNVDCEDCHVAGIYFWGLPESVIEEVEMENVRISFAKDAQKGRAAMMNGCDEGSRQGIFIRNAAKVVMKNVSLSGCAGKEVDLENVDEFIRQ